MGLRINFNKIRYIFLLVLIFIMPGQSVSAKTIGVIMTADIAYYQDIHKAFLEEISGVLSKQGYEVVIQKPMPDAMSWTNAARKLVTIGSDIIISYGAPATLTIMKETSDIPILFAGVYDPESMNMTGKNAIGVSSSVSVEALIKGLNGISKLTKLGILFSKSEKDTIIQIRDIKKSEGAIGFQSVLISVTKEINQEEIKGVNALLLTTCSVCVMNIKDIVEAARRDKIPTAALIGGQENKGIVLTMAADAKEQGTELAGILKKVLGGARPSEISLIKPGKIGTIINLKEAKTLGLTIVGDLLGKASKIIE